MKLAGLLMFINDIHSLGLKATQNMYLTDSWYWNRDAETRAWSRKFFEKIKRMPSSIQAGDYSAATQYLNAVKAIGTDDGDKVLAQMRKTKINDIFANGGYHPRRRPHGARHVPDAGQDAGRVDRAVGLLQDRADVQGRSGLDDQGRHRSARSGSRLDAPSRARWRPRAADPAQRRSARGAGERFRAAARRPTLHALIRTSAMDIFGIPIQAFLGQLLLGLVNGSFYAMLSLGPGRHLRPAGHRQFRARRAVHDRRLCRLDRHGQVRHQLLGVAGRWRRWSSARSACVIERTLLKHLYKIDPIYGLLLTFGLALIAEGVFRDQFGVSGQSYPVPELLRGATDLGFMILPNYRGWIVFASLLICLGTWFLIERTRLGAYLRAGTENPALVQAFGINVPVMVMLTYGFGAGLAALAGVLAAPVIQVTPLMGSNLIIIVFAVVVIGGMGSILGSILTGLALGLIEGLTKVFYAEASNIVVFVIMAIVLMVRPAGLFGKEN